MQPVAVSQTKRGEWNQVEMTSKAQALITPPRHHFSITLIGQAGRGCKKSAL